jgi:hypothetical protein
LPIGIWRRGEQSRYGAKPEWQLHGTALLFVLVPALEPAMSREALTPPIGEARFPEVDRRVGVAGAVGEMPFRTEAAASPSPDHDRKGAVLILSSILR